MNKIIFLAFSYDIFISHIKNTIQVMVTRETVSSYKVLILLVLKYMVTKWVQVFDQRRQGELFKERQLI